MKYGIDIDGCLANFTDAYADLLRKVSKRDLLKGDFLSQHAVWDWDKAAGYTSAERSAAWAEIHRDDQFWFNLKPLRGALDAIEYLEELSEDNDVYFITHRSGVQCKQQTEDWLFGHGITHPTVLISGDDKTPLIRGLELDFYTDDKFSTLYKANSQRLESKYVQLYLVDAPYNRGTEINGINRVKDVMSALDSFIGDR